MEAAPFPDRKQQTHEPVAILLVEDDPQFAELVRAQLRRMPWVNSRLEVAATLAAALQRMAAEAFGLVIADLNLPDSRDLDTLAALISAGEQPVIVLTGDSRPALRAGALAAGAYDFLSKDNLSAAALERLVRLASIQSGTYRQVHESEQRFRALVKLSSEFYWESDAEHRVVKLEHGEERHPAVNPLQLGRARWELPSTWPDGDGWAAHRAALEAHLPFRDFEIARLDADGQENWRSISGEPVFDARGAFQGYRGIGRDLTGHKRAQEALRRFRLAMDESADMIVLIDRASMRFIDVNRTACSQLGYTRDELLALGPQDVLPVERSGLERAYDELIADPARHSGMNSQYRCKDGSLLPFESTRHVLRSGSGWIIAAISRDIRPRIAAEKAMRESEARFRSLTALSSDWYWEQDAEFRLTFMSSIERLGLDASRYVGRRRWDQPALNLSEADWAQHRAQLERREPFHDFELERPDEQGDSVWLSLSGEPVYDPDGRFAGYRGVGRDITQRKRDERLKRMEHAVTRCLAGADSASMALQGVLRAICETEKWDCGRYLAVDETAGVLRFGEGWSVPGSGLEALVEAARAITYAPGDGIAGHVWQAGEPLWVPDVQHGPSVTQRVFGPGSGIRGAFAFPASAGGRPVGVLIFNARQVRAPVERLLQATRVIGSQVGQFLQRKRAEELSRGLSSMYVALGAANEAILRAASPDEVFERVCQIAVDAGGFLIGTVFLADRRTRSLKRVAASGVAAAAVEGPAPAMDESQAGGRGLIGLACRTGEPAISNDYQADARVTGRGMSARGFETGSGAVFPLRVEGELAGVFAVQHAERNVFTGELTGLLQRLADNIAFALENFRGEARRRKAKRRLSESEQRFRSLTQLSADVYWEQDEQYRFTAFTDNVRRRNEVAPSATLGKRRWELEHVNMTPADWQRHIAQLEARQPFHDLELCHIVDGRRQWLSTSGEPVFDGGRFKGYRGIVKDITERRRAEELRGLEHSVTRSLAEANGVDEALRGAIHALCLTEGWECGRYFAADARAGRLRFSVGWSVDDEAVQRFLAGSAGFSFAPGEGLAGRVWQDGKPLWVSDIHDERRVMYATLAREAGIRGAFVFPVIGDGRTIGVLSFSSRRSRPPDEALLQAFQVIGSQVGQFVQRKLAEEEVRESESRFRGLTQLSNDWYWEQDAQFRFVIFEGRGGTPGYAPSGAVLGKRVWEVPGIELGSADWEALQAAMHRRESFRNFAYSYRDQKGVRYHVSADGEPLFDAAGRFAGYRGTSRDVTQQRRDDEELRRFRAAMDMSLDAIYLVERSSMRFVDVNAAACRGVGYSREQLLGMGPHDLLRTPREVLEQEYDAVIAQGERGLRSETSYAAGDGRIGWTELHRRGLRTGDGWVIVSVSRDISERKAAEERQARHLRHQERIARFGQSALAKRRPSELVDEAVQNVLEGLDVDAVAYLERGADERELVVRALVGARAGGEGSFVAEPGHPALRALESGELHATAELPVPLPWAAGLRAAALVPVRGERGARGLLCIASRQAQPFAAESLNFAEAAASVLSAGLQRIDSEGRLAYLAQFDSLTGLPNRALLADRFSQMIEIARRHGSALSVLFVDLDEFKMVNDTLGHAGGDELLKEVAVRLQGCVRSGDTVARISGDEFALILADMARPEDAAIVAQKIIDRLAAGFDIHGQEAFVTASIGIAAYPADGAEAEALIGAADAAMYRAKQAGRNAFQFFTSEINQRTRARAQLGIELRRALEREEFVVFYQPKVELASGALRGAEALLRWKHPERGLVSPGEFIPVLEETGLIVPVGEWVLRRACEDVKAWRAAGLAGGPVAVNLSARQFRLQDLHTRIAALVQSAGIDPALIELEITESQLMQDPDHAIRVMRALRDAGMRIAIDDFGTGYSSLSYLTRFPVGALKIDRSFVADVTDDPQDAAIVRTIIEMAHTLGFTVIAEGIETEAQAKYLREHGCEQAQGYLFARPMPAAELAQRLAAAR